MLLPLIIPPTERISKDEVIVHSYIPLIEHLYFIIYRYEQTLVTYITALKLLFDYLISKQLPLRDIYGYISTSQFKEKHKANLEKGNKKEYIKPELLIDILKKLDDYINANINNQINATNKRKRMINALIARMFIKTSLLLPLKTSEIIEKNYLFLNRRILKYNDVEIKMPNSYRIQLIETINYIANLKNTNYKDGMQLFSYLFNALDKDATPPNISSSLRMTYDEIEIYEMLVKKESNGKKSPYVYQPESYKMTAIFNMLQSGTNILYVKKLTGLDIHTLLDGYDINDVTKDSKMVSNHINMSITNSDYYVFL